MAWISAGLYEITRSWDFAWQFPSFAAAAALAFLVFRSARAFGDLPALIALAAFGLNPLSVRSLGRRTVELGSFFLRCHCGKNWGRALQLWIRGAAAASQIDSTFADNALLSLAGGVPKSRARNFVGAVAL